MKLHFTTKQLNYIEKHVNKELRKAIDNWLVKNDRGETEMEENEYYQLVKQYPMVSKNTLPPKTEMLQNAVNALGRIINAIILTNEKIKRSDDEIEKCRTLCNECEFFAVNTKRCLKCGCFVNFKTLLETEHCPVGKW